MQEFILFIFTFKYEHLIVVSQKHLFLLLFQFLADAIKNIHRCCQFSLQHHNQPAG